MTRRWILALGFMSMAAVVAVLWHRSPEARAEGGWTLLPSPEWSDEFSPTYTDGSGHLCEGDPNASDTYTPTFFDYTFVNRDTGLTEEGSAVQNEALVNFYPHVTKVQIEAILGSLGLEILSAWFEPEIDNPEDSMSWFNVEVLSTSPFFNNALGLVAHLNTLPEVEFAEYNILVPMGQFPDGGNAVNPDDPYYTITTVHEAKFELGLRAREAWMIEMGQTKHIGVAVVDCGIDVDHPDLVAQLVTDSFGKRQGIRVFNKGKSVWGDVDTLPNGDQTKDLKTITSTGPGGYTSEHGTEVAGIVAAKTNNGIGVASCAPESRIMSISIPSYWKNGKMYVVNGRIPKGLKILRNYYPTEIGALKSVRVVNMSFGSSDVDSMKSLGKAIKRDLYAKAKAPRNNRVYVASAQNEGQNKRYYPAAYSYVLGVVGVDQNVSGGAIDDFKHLDSNFYTLPKSNEPDLDAYGTSAYFTFYSTRVRPAVGGFADYGPFSGTSAAAPQIAALASLLISQDDTRTWGWVQTRIKEKTRVSDFATEEIPNSSKKIPGVADFNRALGGN